MGKIIKKTTMDKGIDPVGRKTVNVSDILPGTSGGVLNKKVLEAKDKAQAIIDEAVEESEKIRSEAKEVLSRIQSEMERSKKEGFEKGREEALATVTQMSSQLQIVREKFYNNAEPDVIKLVMTIAEKVIGKMVRDNESTIKSIVRQAVESSLGEKIIVRLNPEDHKVIMSEEQSIRDMLDRTKRISFKEDENITKGGCVVETEVGTIDARLETQLKAIKKALEI